MGSPAPKAHRAAGKSLSIRQSTGLYRRETGEILMKKTAGDISLP